MAFLRLICTCSRVCFTRSTFGIWSGKSSQQLLIGVVAFDGAALISSGFKAGGEQGRLVKSWLHPRAVAGLPLPQRDVMWRCYALGKTRIKSKLRRSRTGAVCMNGNLNLCLSLPKKEIWAAVRVCKGKPSYSPQSRFPKPCLVASSFLSVVSFSFRIQFSFCRPVAFNDFLWVHASSGAALFSLDIWCGNVYISIVT